MSAEATGWVWRYSPYRGVELLVHLAIADVVNDAHDNEFWMSTTALAQKSKCARSSVIATLADMQKRGLLELLEAGGAHRRPSRYRFTRPARGLASANRSSDLDRLSVANSIDTNEDTNEACAVIGLDLAALRAKADPECVSCRGAGARYHATAGRDGPCSCTFRREARA